MYSGLVHSAKVINSPVYTGAISLRGLVHPWRWWVSVPEQTYSLHVPIHWIRSEICIGQLQQQAHSGHDECLVFCSVLLTHQSWSVSWHGEWAFISGVQAGIGHKEQKGVLFEVANKIHKCTPESTHVKRVKNTTDRDIHGKAKFKANKEIRTDKNLERNHRHINGLAIVDLAGLN